MTALFVVFAHPAGDRPPSVGKVDEPVQIEAFLAHSSVEAFHKTVLDRLTPINEVEQDAMLMRPSIEFATGELRTVVANDGRWVTAALRGRTVQDACHLQSRDRSVDIH